MLVVKTILLKCELMKESAPRCLKARTGMVYLMESLGAQQPCPRLSDSLSAQS